MPISFERGCVRKRELVSQAVIGRYGYQEQNEYVTT